MGEDECGAGDVADLAGAGGDVLEGAPAAGEQGEPAFSQAAQGALDCVAGAGIDVEFPRAGRLFDGYMNADADAVVTGSAKVGRSAAAARYSPVQRGQGVGAGGGDVVHRAGLHRRDPSGASTAWTLPP